MKKYMKAASSHIDGQLNAFICLNPNNKLFEFIRISVSIPIYARLTFTWSIWLTVQGNVGHAAAPPCIVGEQLRLRTGDLVVRTRSQCSYRYSRGSRNWWMGVAPEGVWGLGPGTGSEGSALGGGAGAKPHSGGRPWGFRPPCNCCR